MASKKKFDRGSYAGKGGHKKTVHGIQPATKGMSIGAVRQRHGRSYFPEPPRGFRLSDEGKVVYPNRGQRGENVGWPEVS